MKLRKIQEDYCIGIDLGTGSVGWAVASDDGALSYFNGKPTWGSRLFDSAQPAKSARGPRSQRRRYIRRRWRLNLLQQLFTEEMQQIDSDFFIRLNQSRLLKEDRDPAYADYRWPLFNSKDFTEKDYYKKFPTIYHLRSYLMETSDKADIRLIYLALHNIVKHRGNFLRQEQTNLSAKNSKLDIPLKEFLENLAAWCDENAYSFTKPTAKKILDILTAGDKRRSDQKKEIAALLILSAEDNPDFDGKKCAEALAGAMLGLKAEFKNVFGELTAEKTSIYLGTTEDADTLRESIPDEGLDLYDSLCSVYAAFILQGLLSYAPGKTISANKVAQYEQYGKDLDILQALVKKYVPSKYDEFFKGAYYPGTHIYDVGKVKGYTKYNLGTSKLSYENFAKEVQKLFKDTAASEDHTYQSMMDGFEKGTFLRRLKTSDNGSIYYQLHLEELTAILKNQGRFYPFLLDDKEKIESLVSFRIPYYVGPLTTKNAPADQQGKLRFAWSERFEGHENEAIKPWTWDTVIDRNKSAENFIRRMTGNCSYLLGEDVLPRCSLMYEFYCVLNELNGAHYSLDGDKESRFDAAQREGIICDLFMRYRTVSYKKVQDWLSEHDNFLSSRVSGGQGETSFESKLTSYIFFAKEVFKVDRLDRADFPMIEEIILWSTLFEDRKILKEKLEAKYADKLDASQIKIICKKRFSGWGRLSRKFLTGIKVEVEGTRKSLIDILWEGNPQCAYRQDQTMVMMEILHDESLGFQKKIDELNAAFFAGMSKDTDVNNLPGSPALRRPINQAMRIIEEIVRIAGKPPAYVFVEVTREEDTRNKGKRTKKRYVALKEALTAFKKEDSELLRELNSLSHGDLDEKLTLYFMQRGKCLYSGKPIDINRLHTDEYEVDHIIPRSYVKDDSFENKALVLRGENQRKTDALLIDPAIRQKMSGYWRSLHDAKLIGDKKFNNLMRSCISENRMKGFIARQIVETSQSIKLLQQMLRIKYPKMQIIPVKAGVTSSLREACGFLKSREANDFHHAHDAYLALRVGLFIQRFHPSVYTNPIGLTHVMRQYIKDEAAKYKKTHRMPGSAGFIVTSFLRMHADKETGEVLWNPEDEAAGITRALNFRQCYITRMPREDSGAFWDATIYSPRAGKNLALPLKEGLDPKKYGSYSREQFAYFFIYEATNPRKKHASCFEFESVPVRIASCVAAGGSNALVAYAQELASGKGLEFVRIVRSKIRKNQLIELAGSRLLITGKKEVRNATELAFSQEEIALIRMLSVYLEKPESCDVDECNAAAELLYDLILEKGTKLAPRLFTQLKLGGSVEKFAALATEEKANIVKRFINIANGSVNMIDIAVLNGSKCAGCMGVTFSKELSNPKVDFYLIDQSVTGMFEKRTRLGL